MRVLSFCLPLCLSVPLSVCPSVCLSVSLSVRLSVCLSLPKCVRIEWDNKLQFMLAVNGYAVGLGESFDCPSVRLSLRPSVCLSVFAQMRQN